jgi:hypothetical protein
MHHLAGVALWAVKHELLHRLLRTTAPVLPATARTVGFLASPCWRLGRC